MSEYKNGEYPNIRGSWPVECFERLLMNDVIETPVGQFPYVSVRLSGNGVKETYDRGSRRIASGVVALLMPRRQYVNDTSTGLFLTFSYGDATHEPEGISPGLTRRALMEFTIGDAALGIYNSTDPKPTLADRAKLHGRSAFSFAQGAYTIPNIPLAAIDISKEKDVSNGSYSLSATLSVPQDIDPSDGLRWMQETILTGDMKDKADQLFLFPLESGL